MIKSHPETRRAALIGAGSGLVAGLVVCVVMTFLDWRLNPGGIFYDTSGTDWAVVGQTAWSWFWPIAFLFAALATPVTWFWLRLNKKAKKESDPINDSD